MWVKDIKQKWTYKLYKGEKSRDWGFPLKIENCKKNQLDWELTTKKAELKLRGIHQWLWETVRKTVDSKVSAGHHLPCFFHYCYQLVKKQKTQSGKFEHIIGFFRNS